MHVISVTVNPVSTGFERDAVIVVGNLYILDSHIRALADIEAVSVFSCICAFGCWVHCQVCEYDSGASTFDGVEDVRRVLLSEIGDCDIGTAGYLDECWTFVAAI